MLLNPFLSAFFLETTSLPLRYQSITIQYFPRTLLPISRRSFAEYPPPLHPTLYTFPLKNLHTCKFCCTFATQSEQSVCRHNKKAFISACFGFLKTGNFRNPKQEGSKRPLGYDYPAAERPCVDCSVWWHFISAWALLAYSCERVYQSLVIENKQR